LKKHLEIFCIDFIKRSLKYALFLPTNRKKDSWPNILENSFKKGQMVTLVNRLFLSKNQNAKKLSDSANLYLKAKKTFFYLKFNNSNHFLTDR